MPPRTLRDIRYEPEAQQTCDDACEWYTRAHDQIELIEWIIARDPTEGMSITESGKTRALTVPGALSISAPTVTYVYEMEDQYITVKSARFVDAKPETQTRH
jgi:hypothetical protein